ncbi:MAG: Omp28-related outer membrane protein [Sphingobacteriales bacterium]|nr:MAG: Omp28-related outer membrane protein [Sphingobacteriales bacterium]
MKKLLLPLLAVCALGAKAQYSQSFSTGTLTYNTNTVGDIPANMIQLKNTPHAYNAAVSVFASPNNTKAFLIAKLTNGDTVAVASSYFTSALRADNWLITPQFSGITANTMLVWDDLSSDPTYPDSVEVRITTSTSANPTAADFTTVVMPLTIAGNNGDWATKAVSLAAYAGQTIRVGFHHLANDGYYLFMDDIRTVEVTTQRDIAVEKIFVPKYNEGTLNIKATVRSFGSQPVTSFRLNYKIGSGATVSQTFTTPMSYLSRATVNFSAPASMTASGNVEVWVDQINSAADQVASNNMLQRMSYYIANKPQKNVLIEEFTGAWCQYCPDGQTKMMAVINAIPGTIGASIHNQDAMVNTDAQVIDQTYATGYPSGLIDRFMFENQSDVATNRGDWMSLTQQRKASPVPVKVTFTSKSYNAATRQLSVTVKADFVAAVAGDYRIGLMVIEDDVYNSNNVTGWTQVNAYNGDASSEWYQKGAQITGFKHKHVVEAMLGGPWGEAGVIPASVTAGQSFTKTFTWTVPAKLGAPGTIYRWNENNMHIIGYVSEYDAADVNNRPILNSGEASLVQPLSINNAPSIVTSVKLYPNPASDVVTLEMDIEKAQRVELAVINSIGQVVYTKGAAQLNAGSQSINIPVNNLPSGMYSLIIKTENGNVAQKFNVIK